MDTADCKDTASVIALLAGGAVAIMVPVLLIVLVRAIRHARRTAP